MARADRFEELAASVVGFYQSWVVYLGLGLGLFAAIRDAGGAGIAPDALAAATGCQSEAVGTRLQAPHSPDLVRFEAGPPPLAEDWQPGLLAVTDSGSPV